MKCKFSCNCDQHDHGLSSFLVKLVMYFKGELAKSLFYTKSKITVETLYLF